jgi:hypothetical protein
MCQIYALGKQNHWKAPKKSPHHMTQAFGLIYIDLCAPFSIKTLFGAESILTFPTN